MSSQDQSTLISLAILGVSLVMSLVSLIAMVRILHRTGYSGWWILTMMVPVLNIVMLWIYSRAAWPALSAGGWSSPAPARAQAPQQAPRSGPIRAAAPQRGPVTVSSTAARAPERPDDYVF